MYPKKPKELISKYAASAGIPPEDTEAIVQGFWKALRKQVSAMEYWRYAIPGIGHIKCSKKRVEKEYYLYLEQKALTNTDTTSYKYVEARDKMVMLGRMLKVFKEEYKKEKEYNHKKFSYRIAKQNKNNGLDREDKKGLGK